MPTRLETAHDALVSELLGDLGKVERKMSELPKEWDKTIKEACDKAMQDIEAVGKSTSARAKQSALQERDALRLAVKQAVDVPIAEAAETIRKAVEMYYRMIADMRQSRLMFYVLSFFFGFVGALTGSIAMVLVLG